MICGWRRRPCHRKVCSDRKKIESETVLFWGSKNRCQNWCRRICLRQNQIDFEKRLQIWGPFLDPPKRGLFSDPKNVFFDVVFAFHQFKKTALAVTLSTFRPLALCNRFAWGLHSVVYHECSACLAFRLLIGVMYSKDTCWSSHDMVAL